MECGTRGRLAFLFGVSYHDSWCSHNGKILVFRRGESSSIPLSGCPSVVRFGKQGLLAIATVTGQLIIANDNEVLSSTEVHQLAVTSFEWISPQLIISTSLDGHISTHILKSFSLEEQRSVMLRVSDLPRKMRKSNSTSRPTGITSLCVANERVFVGGETGAIWSVTLPELSATVIRCDMDGVETLLFHSPFLITISPSAKAKILTQDGILLRVIDCDVRIAHCDRMGLLLCGDNEQLSCWNIENGTQSMQYAIPHIAFTIDDEEHLITVDKHLTINVYKLAYDS
uniref:WD_REPEATS_REGION domain-containing protein n=1 Tax=Ascaris lumbricoides TaxID=6252 RepID=A0A0M3HNW8_ASCLU